MSSVILVVEDDRELREAVRRYLERDGYAVHTPDLDLGLPDVDGLRRGADEYDTKPFSPTEFVLRAKAVLHRTKGTGSGGPESPAFGGARLGIDDTGHEAHLDRIALERTPTAWGQLTALAVTPGRVFSHYELVNRVRVRVRRLRRHPSTHT
jgi:DNA-binding response OmpR family regulator